ncbi:helix-turn-helix domain-containing GNAT family N-acetyltransferase [Tritonibacter litoralis]
MTDIQTIRAIRLASRLLVRELGFMGGDFAGTDLPPSAVHALIEIEGGDVTAKVLCHRLHLEKSSVSRMLRKLITTGLIAETPGADARVKSLSLTDSGRKCVAEIHTFASSQVKTALAALAPSQTELIADGLSLYAEALAKSTPPATPVTFHTGYQTGLIARVVDLHISYYARKAGFDSAFEAAVAGGLADFVPRLTHPQNEIWTATHAGQIIGSIAIDGQDLGDATAHLRWFIVDPSAHGTGIGRALLQKALAFVDEQGFETTQLWTFHGLHAARRLYESEGFVLASEYTGRQWGTEVLEQRFDRKRRET